MSPEQPLLPIGGPTNQVQSDFPSKRGCLGRVWTWIQDTASSCVRPYQYWRRETHCGVLAERYSQVAQSYIILALTGFYFATYAAPNTPESLRNISYWTWTMSGLVGINYQVGYLAKSVLDAHSGRLSGSCHALALGAGRVVYTLVGGSFVVSRIVAATLQSMGNANAVQDLYSFSRPIGVGSVIFGGALQIYGYWQNKKVIRLIKAEVTESQARQIASFLARSEYIKGPESRIAALGRTGMDKDTWYAFQQILLAHDFSEGAPTLPLLQGRDEEGLRGMVANLETQNGVAKASFLLTVAGDVAMAVSDLYQGTWVEGGIGTVFSLGYTAMYTVQVCRQKRERDDMLEQVTPAEAEVTIVY